MKPPKYQWIVVWWDADRRGRCVVSGGFGARSKAEGYVGRVCSGLPHQIVKVPLPAEKWREPNDEAWWSGKVRKEPIITADRLRADFAAIFANLSQEPTP